MYDDIEEGPRERMRRIGIDALNDGELLAALLGTGVRREPVALMAARVLHECGGLMRLATLGLGGLEQIPGLGPTKASRIVAAIEIGRRIAARPMRRGKRLISSSAVDAALRPRLGAMEAERFIAIALDAKQRPIAELEIARGGLSVCPVSLGDVFRNLLREAAAAVIFVHNHPSGDPIPSRADIDLTARLRQVGSEICGITVLDHVVVASEGYVSLADRGWV